MVAHCEGGPGRTVRGGLSKQTQPRQRRTPPKALAGGATRKWLRALHARAAALRALRVRIGWLLFHGAGRLRAHFGLLSCYAAALALTASTPRWCARRAGGASAADVKCLSSLQAQKLSVLIFLRSMACFMRIEHKYVNNISTPNMSKSTCVDQICEFRSLFIFIIFDLSIGIWK